MDTKPDRTLMWTIIGVFVAVATGIIAFLAWVHPFSPPNCFR
jgi:hypothetical protein